MNFTSTKKKKNLKRGNIGFTESYILPKSSLDQIMDFEKGKNLTSAEGEGPAQAQAQPQAQAQQHGLRDDDDDDDNDDDRSVSAATFFHYLNEKRQKTSEMGSKSVRPVGAFAPPPSSLTEGKEEKITSVEDEKIAKLFENANQYKVLRILAIIRKHQNLISWDPSSLEVSIYGKRYAGSSLMDILSYWINGTAKVFASMYPRVGAFQKGSAVPQQADKLFSLLKSTSQGSAFKSLLNPIVLKQLSNLPTEVFTSDIEAESNAMKAQDFFREEAVQKFERERISKFPERKLFQLEKLREETRNQDQLALVGNKLTTELKRKKKDMLNSFYRMPTDELEIELDQLEDGASPDTTQTNQLIDELKELIFSRKKWEKEIDDRDMTELLDLYSDSPFGKDVNLKMNLLARCNAAVKDFLENEALHLTFARLKHLYYANRKRAKRLPGFSTALGDIYSERQQRMKKKDDEDKRKLLEMAMQTALPDEDDDELDDVVEETGDGAVQAEGGEGNEDEANEIVEDPDIFNQVLVAAEGGAVGGEDNAEFLEALEVEAQEEKQRRSQRNSKPVIKYDHNAQNIPK